MQVFHIATECSSIVSAGGLGDVVFQIAKQCAATGFQTTIVLPYYGKLDDEFQKRHGQEIERACEKARRVPIPLSFPGKTDPSSESDEYTGFVGLDYPVGGETVRVCLLDAPRFRRINKLYSNREDVFPANVLLQKAALRYIREIVGKEERIAIHAHDAHVGTMPMIARRTDFAGLDLARQTFVTTAHNCGWGYRQRLWMNDFQREVAFLTHVLNVSERDVLECVIEDGDPPIQGFEPFAAAALFGDFLTIVSEGYCWEILQAGRSSTSQIDQELLAFAKFLHERRNPGGKVALRAEIAGITNGIDPEEVGPEALPGEVKPQNTVPGDFSWKPQFKTHFLQRIQGRIPRPEYWGEIKGFTGGFRSLPENPCLFTYVGRFDRQKGIDILARASEEILSFFPEACLCLLGDGDIPDLKPVAAEFPGRVVILNGRSERVAKEIYAAGDFFLIPSRFEPCGLTDFRAQLNGNIPIANQVGGLSKVIKGRTGIGFFGLGDREILRGLSAGMLEALDLFIHPDSLGAIREKADFHVRQNHTWEKVIPRFHRLYEQGPR
jgi:starch synthase